MLRKMLRPGTEVYARMTHCSTSGMSRHFAILVIAKAYDGRKIIRNISGMVSTVLGLKWNGDDTVTIGGAGMDMGFAIVYALGRELYPDGFKLGKNQHGRNGDPSPYDNDGGYALEHRSL